MALDIADTLEPRSNGTKRSRTEYEADTSNGNSHSVHEVQTPDTLRSRCPTPDVSLHYFEDDCHEEYEFIRVPKKRDYDIFRVAHREPADRDQAELPLTATKPSGAQVTMWAKLDTGADVNTINLSTLEALLGEALAHKRMRTMTARQFDLIGDNHFDAKHSVDLDFVAGKSKKAFHKVNFIVIPDNAETADTDGVPNVLLGLPFLQESHMLMIDVEYCCDAEEGLPVIAKKAEEESANSFGGILPVKLKPQQGFVRPR
ncbi:hypothetical protein LTR36_007224 [Oleoguttula mirabilis]|uniref:Peptidase A2 domain-containing protein n=1 Tax=Oleoguttula mirabilis TaxID=1507867 RepID=A0AAV9JAM5_9PEZI|nr:hypothetical protein LTR36_007224 [Oleoguttula mirabilis]